MGKIKNCEHCGIEFEDKHRDGKRFCGRSCSLKARIKKGDPTLNLNKSGKENSNWKGGIPSFSCQQCGTDFKSGSYSSRMFCSRGCASKHNWSTRIPQDRKILKRDGKICETCRSIFFPKSKKAKYCSKSCYHSSPSFIELQGTRMRGKSLAEHVKQAVSKATSARSAEKEFSYGKSGHHVSNKAGNIFYRSSYEKVAYEMLDASKNVASYQPEPFVIIYLNEDGKTRRYRPDILVNKVRGKAVLIEVKPEWKLKDAKTLLKLAAGKAYAKQKGWGFEIWTEKKLGLK